jgi:alpha-glucosidase (family GH31 glycosyl hydrolase)
MKTSIIYICYLVFIALIQLSCTESPRNNNSADGDIDADTQDITTDEIDDLVNDQVNDSESDVDHGVDSEYQLGNFFLVFDFTQSTFSIFHSDNPEKQIWYTGSNSLVEASKVQREVEEQRGSYNFVENSTWSCTGNLDENLGENLVYDGSSLSISGSFAQENCPVGWRLSFFAKTDSSLGFKLEILPAENEINLLSLNYGTDSSEKFFGFGEQFTWLNLKGRKVIIISQEQGIGRGAEPVTSTINTISPGSGGDWYTTYAAVPHYITSKNRSLFLENTKVSLFDLENPDKVKVQLHGKVMEGRILAGSSPLELIEEYTAWSGRMPALPSWLNQGAVVGMQGGTAEVYAKLQLLENHNTPIAAFWLQDWVGKRSTLIGSQLWWNWELNETAYPDWGQLVSHLEDKGIRVMGYVNPFLVDVSGQEGFTRNLFAEAESAGYLVKNQEDQTYLVQNTDFSAGMIDLSNPAARTWFKNILKEEMSDIGFSGWMADFAEALPFDAKLYDQSDAAAWHNKYPVEWARLNREFIQDEGLEGETVFFNRAGFSRSPAYCTLFWLGDQLVTFDGDDGMKSAIKGMISAGFSGYSLNHSDIGGYTTISAWIKNWYRSEDLLLRWMEMAAFTPVFRTHEGNQPENNVQFYSNPTTLEHFSTFAKVYQALAFYREELMVEAAQLGYPLVRHPFLHYPDDPVVADLEYQWMLGSEFMVAPVVSPNSRTVDLYLPKGNWVHLWSGDLYGDPAQGSFVTINDAFYGFPPVFYKQNSPAGLTLVQNLVDRGIL